jgi:signal transduction histidine kinase
MKRSEPAASSAMGRRPRRLPAQGARRDFLHEVTSPIAAIKLSAHALRASDTLSARHLADVHRIEEAAEMVARLVESFEPPTTKPGGRLTPPAAHDPVDLYIICCDLAQIRRRTEGAIIHCRAFGDPRVGGDRRRITRVLADILDHAVTRVERGAPMTIAVTGMARHVRVDVHGFGSLGPAKRKGGVDGLSQIGDLLAGTMVAATVSPNGGSIFTLRLPR